MAPTKTFLREFGQQHTIPNDVGGFESRYFTAEETDTALETEDEALTRPLRNIHDIVLLTNYAFNSQFDPTAIGTTPAITRDFLQGHLWVKGMDTYTIRNQADEDIFIKAYVCHVRKDYKELGASNQNVYALLGKGFQERGYDPSNGAAYNGGLTRPAITPYDSSTFTRVIKIKRSFNIRLKPAQMRRVRLVTGWKAYRPLDYSHFPGNTGTSWAGGTLRFDYIKGERFILFKLFANPGAVTGQTTFFHNIGQTNPGIIMHTARNYKYKHLPILSVSNMVHGVPHGIVTGATVIMRDEDFKEGPATVAD